VPAVLQSGHHAHIERWRHEERLRRTALRRPDLLERWLAERGPVPLTVTERAVLEECGFQPPPAAVAD
jgi:tRNA (guanine37-N1)-methyltransferase